MKMTRLLIIAGLAASAVYGQSTTLSATVKQNFNNVKNNILKAAEKMPDADYSFKPAPESRTFGEAITHIATVEAALCGAAKGEDKKIDASKSDKASAVAALKAANEYCDPIYDALNDTNGLEMGKMFGRDMAKFSILNFNVIHDNEMYGTIAVYLRAKGQVPPSSEGRGGMKK